jgi:hypothetical protein
VPFDARAALSRLVTILTPLVQQVYVGVPGHVDAKVCAYLNIGSQRLIDKANALQQRELRLICTFVYAIDGNVAEAEEEMAEIIDAFLPLIFAERTNPGSALQSLASVDMALVDEASYEDIAAEEFRRYPVAITVIQQANM